MKFRLLRTFFKINVTFFKKSLLCLKKRYIFVYTKKGNNTNNLKDLKL